MIEKINILDENGSQTDKIISREDAHRLGLWHRCSHVWIINENGDILLQKRSGDKTIEPNKWSTAVSGHLSAGDTSKQNAIRELNEEIGLKIKEEELDYLFTVKEQKEYDYKGKNFFNKEITDVYCIQKDLNIDDLKLQKEEISEVKWFPYDEFKKMVLEQDENLMYRQEMQIKMLDVFSRYQ